MCVIYYADNKTVLLNNAKMADAATEHSHGCGVMFSADKKIQIIKSASSADWPKILADVPVDVGLGFHFRWATGSKKNKQNAHPFMLAKSGAALMHNGIVSGWGDDNISDTREICERVLGSMDYAAIKGVTKKLFHGSRILLLAHNGKQFVWHRWGTWHIDGNWPDGEFCQSSHVAAPYVSSQVEYVGRKRLRQRADEDTSYGCMVGGVWIPNDENGKQWRGMSGTTTNDWLAFCGRPLNQSVFTFRDWWEAFGKYKGTQAAPVAAPATAPQSNAVAPVVAGSAAGGYGVSWTRLDRLQYKDCLEADFGDWNDFVSRPQTEYDVSFLPWFTRKLEAEKALEVKAAGEIQAALASDETVASGDVVACDDAPQSQTGSVTECGGEQGANMPAQCEPCPPKGIIPMEPWLSARDRKTGKVYRSVTRWAAKFPHDAAELILDLWEDCGLPPADCLENDNAPMPKESDKQGIAMPHDVL